jgi:hypothetical protein
LAPGTAVPIGFIAGKVAKRTDNQNFLLVSMAAPVLIEMG